MEMDTVKTRRRITDVLPKTATPEQLEKIAEILGVQVAYLPEPCTRPNFGPDQVRCVCQIGVGLTYNHAYMPGYQRVYMPENKMSGPFKVLEKPFYRAELSTPGWWVKVRSSESGCAGDLSLQDVSVHHYHGGTWNSRHYIAFTDDSRHLKDIHHCRCNCSGHSHGHHNCC